MSDLEQWREQRLGKLAERLDGKELTGLDLSPPLKALRDLQPGIFCSQNPPTA